MTGALSSLADSTPNGIVRVENEGARGQKHSFGQGLKSLKTICFYCITWKFCVFKKGVKNGVPKGAILAAPPKTLPFRATAIAGYLQITYLKQIKKEKGDVWG